MEKQKIKINSTVLVIGEGAMNGLTGIVIWMDANMARVKFSFMLNSDYIFPLTDLEVK